MKRFLLPALVFGFLSLLFHPAIGPTASAAELTELRLGNVAKWSASGWIVQIAEQEGIFRKHGLNPKITWTYKQEEALLGGSIDISSYEPGRLFLNRSRGADVRGIGVQQKRPGFAIVTRPEIKTLADLEGKIMAVSGVPAGDQMVVLTNIEVKHGIKLIYRKIGGSPQRLAAVANKLADAAPVMTPIHFRARELGLNVLVAPEVMEYPWLSYNVRKPWLDKNRGTAVKLLRALYDTIQWMYDPANERSLKQFIKGTLRKPTEAIVNVGYDFHIKSRNLDLREYSGDEMEILVKGLVAAGVVPKGFDWRQAVDNSLVQEVLKK